MAETVSHSFEDQNIDSIVEKTGAAMRSGNLDAANEIASNAIDSGIEHPFLLKAHGLWLNAHGRYQEALRAFHHARELAPDDTLALNGIAGVLSAMNQYDPALKVLEESLRLDPAMAPTHYLRGWCLEGKGDYARAREAYENTLSLQPDYVQALAGHASVSVQLRDYQGARASARRALGLQPGQPTASIALAMAEIAEGSADIAEKRMRTLLSSQISGQPRVIALGVMGDALDALGKTNEAYQAYAAKNAAFRDLFPGRSSADNIVEKGALGLHANLVRTTEQWTRPPTGKIDEGAGRHVFIVGFPRSGAANAEQCLALHPDIVLQGEEDLLAETAQLYLSNVAAIEKLLSASEGELDAVRQTYWQQVREKSGSIEGKVFVEKLPMNTIKLPLIARLFPNAHILFAVRDPRDVVLSNFRQRLHIAPVAFELSTIDGAARVYDATMRIGDWSRKTLPIAFQELKYEKFVTGFLDQMREIVDFVGLALTENMADFAKAIETNAETRNARQMPQGFHSEDIDHWRKYAAELAPVLPILDPWVAKYGYAPS